MLDIVETIIEVSINLGLKSFIGTSFVTICASILTKGVFKYLRLV